MSQLELSPKFKDFIKNTEAKAEFLEGVTSAGKTTVGVPKFMLMVARSPKKLHILAGLDLGTIEKNIINKDLGIADIFGDLVEYYPAGGGKDSMPHIKFHTDNGEKVIYVLGYDNKARWKKALGGQYGCMYIDELNIADIDFVREAFMRCDYVLCTMNPDDPNLPCFSEYVNRSRPLKKWESSVPSEIMQMLTEPAQDGWEYWFFGFDDNAALTEEKKRQIISSVPPGTKLYKNKILGLRGRASGLVFPNFSRARNVISLKDARGLKFKMFSCGVDTAYSRISEDTIAFIFQGITEGGRLVVLDEQVINNKDLEHPLAPSDVIKSLDAFIRKEQTLWGFAPAVFIDSADQATITEAKKFLASNPRAYQVAGAWKKLKIVDRIDLQLGWIHTGAYLVVDTCHEHIRELEIYSWMEDKSKPEDRNDHTINASQYGWIPYKNIIGAGN